MSGLQARTEDTINGVDVREQGSALRVATNTPHLVSLGTGRLSTAVTLHPIKQGRVTIGSDPTCDIYVVGTGVASVHCRVENSHGVVTLYPIAGSTLLDGLPVDKPTRLSQGSMLTIGRSNYLRFNHPAEAMLMKSVLPSAHVSMAPIQFTPNEQCLTTGYVHTETSNHCYQNKIYKDSLTQLDQELDSTLKEISRTKPPVAPKKYRDFESDSNSDQESKPKMTSIMAKVSKFEYYAKQHKHVGRSQFYTNENEISPKVFSSNSLTVNTPAKDVLGGKPMPNYINKIKPEKIVLLNENNAVDAKTCSYANVAIRNNTKIGDIVKNFDDTRDKLPKKVNNDQVKDNIYGKINVDRRNEDKNVEPDHKNNIEASRKDSIEKESKIDNQDFKNEYFKETQNVLEASRSDYGKVNGKMCLPSPAFDRNPQYSPVCNGHYDRGFDAENMRNKAYQERIKEEEKKEAEMERLEEILDIFTEYQRQLTSDFRAGIPITPTEKRSHNKIITNGSLPRSVAYNSPNLVQTSDGYYKFDTNHGNNLTKSLPTRNLSGYENFDVSTSPTQLTPEVSLPDNNYENVGRMDEIGIPVYEDNNIPSPVNVSHNETPKIPNMPSPSPYENVYVNRNVYNNFKPKSPNISSPRTRIKTTFAHKNVSPPQYFIFPTPPPVDNSTKPNFNETEHFRSHKEVVNKDVKEKSGIEKQLSLEEEIPMIDDAEVTNDIEFRYSKVITDKVDSPKEIQKNQSFDDVKKELMADIPELEAFENDLKQNKRENIIKNITEDFRNIEIDDCVDGTILDINIEDLKARYETLKEDRRKFVTEIHEIKCKMTEIRSQEDEILRELEMEKALIKGEYDSEIAILNIEQKKKTELLDKAKKIEEEIKQLKNKQETRQNEMRDRVEVATTKVERLEKDVTTNVASVEELQNAQDILDNETKMFEDLEFQHLEEESELLSNREDIQNEIMILSKKIDAQKSRILTLKSEANNNLTSALDETKVLHAEYVKLLNKVEDLTSKVQSIEKELKPIVVKLNEIERAQSPDSAFYTDQTRTKSGEFGYSPQSSDSDDIDLKMTNFEEHAKELKDKFNSIDQMSQSMTVDLERRVNDKVECPKSKEKKGFWERNFDSLKRKKKPKSPEKVDKVDIMSQSLNENIFYNNESIENDAAFDRFNSLRNSKKKEKKDPGPIKSSSSSKIPTFAALGKIIKKDSFGKKSRETDEEPKTRYIKNSKPITIENKYVKSKSLSPDKVTNQIVEETHEDLSGIASAENSAKNSRPVRILHRKSCGDEPSVKEFSRISDSSKIPSQDDIDRISKVTTDAPIFSSDTDMNSLGKRTYDSLMEIERKRIEMLEEQGCQMIENEREKISELKRRAQDETKKLWDQKNREKSIDSDVYSSLTDDQRESGDFDPPEKIERSVTFEEDNVDRSESIDRSPDKFNRFDHPVIEKPERFDRTTIDKTFDRSKRSFDRSMTDDSSLLDDSFMMNSTIYEESSGLMSTSIEELQVRHSRTESTEDDKRSDDSRPLSHNSDFSRDNILSLSSAPRRSRRGVAPYSDSQRPLTRYLPVDRDDFDLRRHVESAGHQIELCPHVSVTATSCRGYLHKLGAKFHTWSKRWFVFDRETKTFVYYWDKSEKKPRGGAYFQVIEEVYLDHGNSSRSPSPATTFIVKTRQRRYCLMAASGAAARIWIDVIFTGAQGYTEYLE